RGDTIGRMVGTDSFWVRATLPISDLKRIRLPSKGDKGASAGIVIDTGGKEDSVREGTVVRLLSDLESTGRMARVLIEVSDPLNIGTGADSNDPLLLGSYVRVDIEAGHLSDVLTVPRSALREGNRLWVVGQDNRIRIVEPEILWTLPETVLVENQLQSSERLVVSELKSALPGMLVNPQPLEADQKATDKP
ncbi:MAG: HlyD family efflux transporter periplasmic adaptor subunit, partial [Verrucomicrobiales bacterium]|nr:HlyD family efflux transporter periplasmic adaptor subunit [Verrucomicrobiales bacterium]